MSIKLLAFCRRDVNFLRKPAIFFLIIIITINLYLTINKKYDKILRIYFAESEAIIIFSFDKINRSLPLTIKPRRTK